MRRRCSRRILRAIGQRFNHLLGARRLLLITCIAVLAVLASPTSALAVLNTPGHVYAFGLNEAGELGITTNVGTNTANPTPTAVALPGATGYATEVAVGSFWTLVVTSSGQLFSFGSNVLGELGTTTGSDTFAPEPTPELVTLPGATGPVVHAAGGENFSLALTSTGQLYGFGANASGELARTPPANVLEPNPTPTLITVPGVTFTQVAAGSEHVLAVSSTGVLYTFGEDRYGQLGYETAENVETNQHIPNPTPTPVTLPGASGPVTQVSAGLEFSLALTSTGQLYAFGENAYGQLGSPPPKLTFSQNPTPTAVSLPGATGAITHIAAGQFYSLISTASGQLYAFGANQCGQLGLSTNAGNSEPNPTPTLVALPGASGRVSELAPGAFQSLVLTEAGQLYAFGCNGYGQLGSTLNNGNILTPNPTPTLVTLPAGDAIESIGRGGEALSSFVIASATIGEVLPPGSPRPGPEPGTAPVTSLALTITHASFSNSSFRVAKGATAISAKRAPLGTSINFRLSAAARVQIKLTRSALGLRHGSLCVAPNPRLVKAHAKHCTRTLTLGTLTRAKEHAGTNAVAFSGRIGRRALKPGSYHAVLSASNAEAVATPVTLSFVIAPSS
jgi:alpha-tubulin suppressor-like RCC1 family protein